MTKEIWRPVKGYEGLYEVSNRGRVRSVDRLVTCKDGSKRFFKGRILKTRRDKQTGYLLVTLCCNGKLRTFSVHRLVAMAWLDNPEGKPEINHRDEDKTNNSVENGNLEWVSAKENSNFGTRTKRQAASRSKSVQALDPETGVVVLEFPSAKEAERNGFKASAICNCCRGVKSYRTHRGYRWRYKPTSTTFDYSRMLEIYDIALEQYRKKTKTA